MRFWVFPVLSAFSGLATLTTMLTYWIVTGRAKYTSMQEDQTIAYISDIGADQLKPLFILGCVISSALFNVAFVSDRWLRNRQERTETMMARKVSPALSVLLTLAGSIALCCLSGFDIARFPLLHHIFLILFITGYLSAGLFTCWEYYHLGMGRFLRISFYAKLIFFLVEIGLATTFVVAQCRNLFDSAAILEWAIAYVFYLYIFSFSIDFL
ncbi:Frag1/DRAM/Sfk1 family protein [Apiospora saccharicola]